MGEGQFREERCSHALSAVGKPCNYEEMIEQESVVSVGDEAASFVLAVRPFDRLRGMALVSSGDDMVLIAPCKDVHTIGMRADLDIAFVDDRGVVLEVFRNVAPQSRRRCAKAAGVIERKSRAGAWLVQGDRLAIGRLSSVRVSNTDALVEAAKERRDLA